MISFTNPFFLLFLFLMPVIIFFYLKFLQKKKESAIKFSNLNLIKEAMSKRHNIRKHLSFYLTISILFLMILAFSNPHIPLKQTKEGVNVVLSLDVSGSMQAKDYEPNRLEAAKQSAITLVKSLNPKDHIGVVIFESGATTSAYLTPFKEKVITKIDGISLRDGKTAIGDGLALAVDMASSIPNKKKIVILLSDGVSNSGVISPNEAIAYAKQNKVQVYSIGMGSNENTVLGYDWFGRPQYAKLDEATLKAIAEQTGGTYFKSVDTKTLDKIYNTISKDIEREKELTSIKDYLFALALIILLIQIYLSYGKYRILK